MKTFEQYDAAWACYMIGEIKLGEIFKVCNQFCKFKDDVTMVEVTPFDIDWQGTANF